MSTPCKRKPDPKRLPEGGVLVTVSELYDRHRLGERWELWLTQPSPGGRSVRSSGRWTPLDPFLSNGTEEVASFRLTPSGTLLVVRPEPEVTSA